MDKVVYYLRKSFRDPELIVPFIKQQIVSRYLDLKCKIHKENLDSQLDLINNIREEDEFLLIVLDACRYDVLNDVVEDYFPQSKAKPVYNKARNTFEWGKNVWGNGLYTCKYISGAVPINSKELDFEADGFESLYDGYVPAEHLLNLRDAWAEAWDEDLGIAPPEPITEIALEEGEDRMVVHYFQPHAPYIGEEQELGYTEGKDALPNKGKPADKMIWDKVKSGEISDEKLRELYRLNLYRVLKSVEELVEKVNHDNIVITADHGEALGECGIYEHPENLNHPKVRVVPWVEVN
ncbi:hypothetical protein GKQ38_04565 [Candidatus Nanohaloarchaea archaeon]|nr:hypothetical protein GKQ38_04565 [Candidatus Nanohaloarchaea archaeon]